MARVPYRGIPRLPGRGRDVDAVIDTLEVLTGSKGDRLYKALTLQDLADYGLVTLVNRLGTIGVTPTGNGGGTGNNSSGSSAIEQPHAPEDFTATAGFFDIILQWTHAHFNGYAYTEIYRSGIDDFASAVRIGTEIGTFFVDSVGPASKFYYWARFVNTLDAKGPVNATHGTYAETAPNISQVMQDLSDSISEGQLAQALKDRINLIDAPNTGLVDGLHNEQVSRVSGQNNLQQQIDSIAVGFAVNNFYQPNQPTLAESTEGDRWFDTDDGNHPYLFTGGAWVDVSDQRILNNTAAILSEQTARITAQDAQSTRINTLQAAVEDPSTGLQANATAYNNLSATVTALGSSLSANTTEISQIQAIVGTDYIALQTIKSVTIDPGGLTAQWMLKTDVNGYIAGFGLYNNGATSQALFNVDTFVVGKPGAVGKYPFIISGGVVYIDVAMIANASIQDAKIGSLSADKITAGILNAARIAANSITSDKIDSRGLSIKDQNGNVILSAGQQLSTAYITGLGTLALLNSLAYGSLTGTKPPTNADNTASNIAAGIFGQGAFATLSQLNAANISTYIQAAAIGRTLIGVAAIGYAQIGDAEVGTLKIGPNSVVVPVIVSGVYSGIPGDGRFENNSSFNNNPNFFAWHPITSLSISNPDTQLSHPVTVLMNIYLIGSATAQNGAGPSGGITGTAYTPDIQITSSQDGSSFIFAGHSQYFSRAVTEPNPDLSGVFTYMWTVSLPPGGTTTFTISGKNRGSGNLLMGSGGAREYRVKADLGAR